jgi:glycosyltransferase involved in cell wall biosynthesis/CDP-glycerol glycerophosphotransferase (TagB/SpsB family)
MKRKSYKRGNNIDSISATTTLQEQQEQNDQTPAYEAKASVGVYKANYTYSVVSAVYNIGRYLTTYLESLAKQTADFTSSIQVILVDDGSTDDSAAIIQDWVRRFPRNIKYCYQENAGQGAARNTGLRYAKNEWVTFIDPDDFVAEDYFEKIDSFISAQSQDNTLRALSANYIYYVEDLDEFSDTHPLKYRFKGGNRVLAATDFGKHITLNVNCVFFRRSRVLEQNLLFSPSIKPGFEDAHFANRYLLSLSSEKVGFVADAFYYYRKRSDGTSTLDTAWDNLGRYDQQLRLGVLGLIHESISKHGYVKDYIQRVALYDLAWHFKRLVNNDQRLALLDEQQRLTYESILTEIMSHISEKTILDFELAGIWFYHKVGLLSKYKNSNPDFNILYIEELDSVKDLIKVKYFCRQGDRSEQFTWDNTRALPLYSTTRRHTLLGSFFIFERIIWLRIGDSTTFNAKLSHSKTRISLKGKHHHKGISSEEIRKALNVPVVDITSLTDESRELRDESLSAANVRKYGDCWLLMDRNTQADDNAEHLYQYLQSKHPNLPIFFILNKDAPDWVRLHSLGFNLIEFGTRDHQVALLNAAHFISSHADQYIFGDLPKALFGDLLSYKFTFLQHGVTKDDISSWMNTKQIDCFVTATHPEYESIALDGSYKFTSKEVALTGFARHDRLRQITPPPHKTLLIMPTWRDSLVGPPTGVGNERAINPSFSETLYAKSWKDFLHAKELQQIAEEHGYEVVFFPHANIQPYISCFDIPDFIKLGGHQPDQSIQKQFAQATVVITDYSSIAFEVAALEKAIIYYQFDAADIFSGGHFYKPGYFDYSKDGFGPVCTDFNSLKIELGAIVANSGLPSERYLSRMRSTFAFKDILNCERTYRAIDLLDQTFVEPAATQPALVEHATRAANNGDWEAAATAWSQLGSINSALKAETCFNLAVAHRNLGLYTESESELNQAEQLGFWPESIKVERLKIAIETKNYGQATSIYEGTLNSTDWASLSPDLVALVSKGFRLKGDMESAQLILNRVLDTQSIEVIKERAEIALASGNWEQAIYLWKACLAQKHDDHGYVQLSKAYRNFGSSEEAAEALNFIEKSCKLSSYHVECAELAYENNAWKSAASHFTIASRESSLDPDEALRFSKALRKSGKTQDAYIVLNQANSAIDQRTLLQETAIVLSTLKLFKEAILAWETFIARKDLRPNRDAWLHLAEVQLEAGQMDAARTSLDKFESLAAPVARSANLRMKIVNSQSQTTV